ncbi:hypothetical protein SAMN02745146_2765 [Hymenobacter daecheongensis DSM 21074]|uniref:Uncharacterized protein n=2 Tax=Hymenobacter daecheongensis TaxID=496053 RepID=A0A1M6I2L4_9BACT|nr:hypothetical protein SAMN02745146_2765 [Hymenobacter daecheongensis DSM 21074]
MIDSFVSPEIISQVDFDRHAAKWQQIITSRHHHHLQRCFHTAEDARMQYVRFPMQHIAWLVSTVGIHHIEARFLVMSEDEESPRFALALYAADARGLRISAYYLSAPQIAATAPTPPLHALTDPGAGAEQVPHYMVKKWLANWRDAPELKPDMFVNSYGPLQGYTFSVGDFMKSLFESQPYGARELWVDLGLHEYYSASLSTQATYTFGLVLRLYQPLLQVQEASDGTADSQSPAAQQSAEPFYDMSTPCPPGF